MPQASPPASGWFLGGILDAQKFNDHLNRLGQQDWELVSVFDTNMGYGQTRDVVAVLKRPLEARSRSGATDSSRPQP